MGRKPIAPMGHPIRQEIVILLDELEAPPPEIRGYLPGEPSPATVAYHLAVLERAGLVVRISGVYRRA